MRRLELALVLVLGLLAAVWLAPFASADTPFGAGPPEAEPPALAAPAFLQPAMRLFTSFQRESNRLIATHMRAVRDGRTSGPLLVAVLLGFVYGGLHTLGPGHGKAVVTSYFLSRDARIGRGIAMGFQIGFVHVISAVVAVLLADVLLRTTFGAPAEVRWVRIVSYALILASGLWMLVAALRRLRGDADARAESGGCAHHGHDHSAHHDHDHAHSRGERSLISLAVGLVPCTGSLLVLLYALANGILAAGLAIVAAIALGMALTMSAIGVASVMARRLVASRLVTGGRGLAVLDLAGALLVSLIGLGLLATA